MKLYKLNVKSRDGIGRGPSRRIRAEGAIPGVIYAKNNSKPIIIDAVEFRTMMRAKGDNAALVEVTIDENKKILSLVKDYQRNAVSQKIVHVDILEVDPNEMMTISIPVRSVGDCVGVLAENGVLEVVREIKIRCLPKDLPEAVVVDVSNLHAGQTIHVTNLPEIPGVTFPKNQNTVVASCLAEDEDAVADDAAAPAADAAKK
ncbi:MAG: 50S ribosomal protein L25 [Opitutales bacterium]|nr:50S ribosomal protein L25 [Opitutales bacterium]